MRKDYGLSILTTAQRARFDARKKGSASLRWRAESEKDNFVKRVINADSMRLDEMAEKLYWDAQHSYHRAQAMLQIREGIATCFDCQHPYLVSVERRWTKFNCSSVRCFFYFAMNTRDVPEQIKRLDAAWKEAQS